MALAVLLVAEDSAARAAAAEGDLAEVPGSAAAVVVGLEEAAE